MAKSRSLSWRLGVSSLVIVLPLSLFALIMVVQLVVEAGITTLLTCRIVQAPE